MCVFLSGLCKDASAGHQMQYIVILLLLRSDLQNLLRVHKIIQMSLKLIYCLWKSGMPSGGKSPQKACGNLTEMNEQFSGFYTAFMCGTILSSYSFRTLYIERNKIQDFRIMYEECRISF